MLRFVCLALVGLSACRSAEDPSDRAGRAISLRADLVPLLDRSCALSACHARPSYVPLLLGPSQSANPRITPVYDASAIQKQLLDDRHRWDRADKPLVSPGHPEDSFLINKLTGNFTRVTCRPNHCGDAMPPQNRKGNQSDEHPVAPLSQREIQMFSDWIAQGALDN